MNPVLTSFRETVRLSAQAGVCAGLAEPVTPAGEEITQVPVRLRTEGGRYRRFRSLDDGREGLRHPREITLARDIAVLVEPCSAGHLTLV